MMTKSALESLKSFSTVVADTGDFESIKKFQPQDATTNPSLILKAAQQEQYKYLVEKTIVDNKYQSTENTINNIIVNFGLEILKIIKGRVSSEVDVRYSFDTKATIEAAKNIIYLYEKNKIERNRVLIKIAATWEGILAAKFLEKEGIHCNLTLIFSLEQAILCAVNEITLISPFVGRILDWYKKNNPEIDFSKTDPGVDSVRKIFSYYKSHDYKTEIMGASFRNIDQILSLAGCDLLTISPNLLDELNNSVRDVTLQLDSNETIINKNDSTFINFTESQFRFLLNEDAMATEKLSEGIRFFVKDIRKLEMIIKKY